MFGIYLQHKHGESVLLTDGVFANEKSCLYKEFGVVWLKPRLFVTKGGASNYAHKSGHIGKRYKVRKYQGPTKPWERTA